MNMFSKAKAVSFFSGTAMLVALSGCESSGGMRLAGVGTTAATGADGSTASGGSDGTASGGATGSSGGTAGDGASGGATAGGSGTVMAGNDGTAAGSGTTGSGTSGKGGTTGADKSNQHATGLVPTALVTTGNALLSTGQTVDATGSGTAGAPVTGTIARVMDRGGQTLVATATGEQILVSGLRGGVGNAVSIVPTLSGSIDANGSGATVAAGPGGNTILATVNGLPNRIISGVAGASPLSALNLSASGTPVSANVAGATVGGANGLVTAGVLNLAPGQGSIATASVLPGNGSPPTASLTTGSIMNAGAAAGSAVTGTAGSVLAPVGGGANVTVANTTVGSSGLVGAGVLAPAPSTGTLATVAALPGNGAPTTVGTPAASILPSVGGIANATVANTSVGSPGLLSAGVLSPAPSSGSVVTATALPGNGTNVASVTTPTIRH